MSKTTVIILVLIGCILLAVGTVSLWATMDVFNADRFGNHVAAGLQSDAATQAMAVPIVAEVLATYPDIPPALKTPAEEVVGLLLQRNVFTTIFKEAGAVAMKVMTTSAEDVVGIDLAGTINDVGTTVVGVISQLDPDAGTKAQTALDISLQEAQTGGLLAIYEQGTTPKLRQLSNTAPWLGILGALGALVLFVVAYVKAADKHGAAQYIGIGIMITSVLGFMLFAPAVQSVAQGKIIDPVMQIVVGSVVSEFTQSFAITSLLVFLIGLIVVMVNHSKAKKDEQAQAA